MGATKPTAAELERWLDDLSNWGRWGPDDQLGTLNHITEEVRRSAAAEVRTGRTVSCALGIDPDAAGMGNVVRRYMLNTGEGLADPHRVAPARRWGSAGDELHLRTHNVATTHLDSLSHISWERRMYGGRPAEAVTLAGGSTQLGIEVAAHGVVTRGVLLDVAAARGVSHLALEDDVFPEDLEAAEQRQGVRVGPGDAVLLATGFSAYRRTDPAWTLAAGQPSWQAACLPWLHEREVSLIAHDGGGESFPSGYPDMPLPVHTIGITAMGLWLLDNCDLEELRATADELGRWTFLFVVAPLAVKGATGSAVNPLATF